MSNLIQINWSGTVIETRAGIKLLLIDGGERGVQILTSHGVSYWSKDMTLSLIKYGSYKVLHA